jgi:ankyrin repeat protein
MKNFELYTKYKDYSQEDLSEEVVKSCEQGNLELIKYLLTSDDLEQNALITYFEGAALLRAVGYNQLEVVRYLLNHTDLVKDEEEFKIYLKNAFLAACMNGHLDIVKYLATSTELKENADIHADSELPFIIASSHANLNIVEYLLFSKELKDNVDIHAQNDKIIKMVISYNRKETIDYLIFDLNIPKSEHIVEFLKSKPNKYVENMFNMRELNKGLKADLPVNNNINKKIKL